MEHDVFASSPHLLSFLSVQAHPDHLWPGVPFGPAHPHLCEVDRRWRVLRYWTTAQLTVHNADVFPEQDLQFFFVVLFLKERVVLPCEPHRSATQSFRSHWLTTERRRAHWQVASSCKPLKSNPLRSYTVSQEIQHWTGLVSLSTLIFGLVQKNPQSMSDSLRP